MLFSHDHLLGIRGLSAADITLILDRADLHAERNRSADKKQSNLRGWTAMNLFYENSTRTRTSFELAGKRLGADVINMSVSHSSAAKGETLIDTAQTLSAMHPDFIIIRHPESGAAHLLAERVRCAVINAGDGCHEHPTQALLDALCIRRHMGRLEGLKVVICGDLLHSRVARSNALLLTIMGADVHWAAPPTLMPADATSLGVTVHDKLTDALPDADIIMMLRLQQERMRGHFIPSAAEYFHFYGLDWSKLQLARPEAYVMHPGPINRGVEISGRLADDLERSLILEQVEMGVAVRQAILEVLAERWEHLRRGTL